MSQSRYAFDSPTRQAMTMTRLHKLNQLGEKIAMLTAYDASFAADLDQAGVDVDHSS